MAIQKNRKLIYTSIIILSVLLLMVDRYYWAQISQWREDQATNIWLGYTSGLGNMPVGLMSSKGIPNPNGMVLLGSILSILPNLLSVSFFLGVSQIILLVLIGWNSFRRDRKYFLLATLPLLSSVILRSSSVEYWNQYTITLVNVFFIYWVIRYLEKPSLWNLPPITILILVAPSLYLAGIANAIVMLVLTVIILLYKRPELKGFFPVLAIVVGIIVLSIYLTWYPYFQNVGLVQIIDYKKTRLGLIGTFQIFWTAIWSLPNYATFQWADYTIFDLTFKHASPQLLSPASNLMLKLMGRVYLLQAVFAFTVFTSMLVVAFWNLTSKKDVDIKINIPALRLVILSILFIGLSYGVSNWLNGPAWIDGERPDQTVQFLPMFLLIIFLLPPTVSMGGRAGRVINWISYLSLTVFSTINILCGVLIIRDHLNYRGNVLTEADVPLIQKMQALDFIATDWKKHSDSDVIPVDYDLGGGVWDWVSEFGVQLLKWYPAPMTEGRSFDYELLRRYGLKNQQEGIQIRSFDNARYLVTYAFEDPPQSNNTKINHYIFGRLRVSVMEK
jgi:hypothetical protein